MNQFQYIAEPGRFFAHQSTSLITKVIGKCCMSSEDIYYENAFRYYLTDGVYGSFNNLIYDHAQIDYPILLNNS